jgi:hypothetical protein
MIVLTMKPLPQTTGSLKIMSGYNSWQHTACSWQDITN